MGLGIAIWIMLTVGVITLTYLSLNVTWKFRNNEIDFFAFPWLESFYKLLFLIIDLFLLVLSVWMIYGILVLFGAAHDIFG